MYFIRYSNTLITSNEEIPNEITKYFTKIKEKYHIVLVIGRTNSYAVEKSKICNASSIVISDNGAIIYNYKNDKDIKLIRYQIIKIKYKTSLI